MKIFSIKNFSRNILQFISSKKNFLTKYKIISATRVISLSLFLSVIIGCVFF